MPFGFHLTMDTLPTGEPQVGQEFLDFLGF